MADLFRYDRGELARAVATREGFLLAEGYIAKPGVLNYIREDGTVQRELVLPETLHDPASLATLGRKPVTLEHPSGSVTPDNVGDLAVGDVDGDIEVVTQGGFVKVRLAVRRRDALDAVQRGDKLELSPGYSIKLDNTPGVHPEFGEYDAIQTERRYNHVALTAAGRGGPSIRLRADSAADTRLQGETMDPKIIAALTAALTKAGIRFDSNEVAKADASGIAAHIGQLADAFGAARDALAAATAKHDQEGVEGEGDEDEETDAEGRLEEDKADALLGWFATRTSLLARADAVKNPETMSNRELRKAVVLAANPEARKDAEDAYYTAAFDMLPKAGKRTDTADAWAGMKFDGENRRKDAYGEDREDAAPSEGWRKTIADQFNARHAR